MIIYYLEHWTHNIFTLKRGVEGAAMQLYRQCNFVVKCSVVLCNAV